MSTYSNGHKKWDNIFAGILADSSTIFVNSNDSLQFSIKIISSTPDNFPSHETKDVTGYGEGLEVNWHFTDDKDLSEIERIERLKEYLEKYVLFFKVQQKGYHYYNGVEWQVARRNVNFSMDMTLEPVPFFSQESTKKTQKQFEEQLINKRIVGFNKSVSKEKDDSPSVILWKNENGEFEAYGDFSSHDYYYSNGFKFDYEEQLYKFPIPSAIQSNSYVSEQVMFLTNEDYINLQNSLSEEGEVLGLTSTNGELRDIKKDTQEKQLNLDELSNDKEIEFIERFKIEARRMELFYTEKDLYNFHIAMKTKSLVILSGMSGTGKSKLVQCYANALGLKSRLFMIPVSPSWQDDSDVIGYLDTLNNLYRPGDSGLVNALITAQADENDDNLYIVCFDEMNLARVEHYFSKFLSVLEQDKSNRSLTLYNDEFETRLYNREQYKASIPIKNNVIFVGTVNEDESTYQFPDKVLDRANVISLEVVPYKKILALDEERRREINVKDEVKIPVTFKEYETFRKKNVDMAINEHESAFLWEFHLLLQECNRNLGIGWRIVRQISVYLNNVPVGSPLTREEAFDLQLVQRVVTKIRGSEEQLQDLLGKYNPETKSVDVENSSLLQLLEALPESYKMERVRKLLVGKARELRLYGHTL